MAMGGGSLEINSKTEMSPEEEEFTARSYQLELFEKAIEENTIVCLKTGAGKTFIAIMMIKEFQHEILKAYDQGKRTFFIVPKVPLVVQQMKAIRNHTVLNVGHFYGEMGVDFWDETQWLLQLQKYHVLVMTAQILLNILNAGYMPLSKINLLVFDECHMAVGKHPYCGIMSRYGDFKERPRILGLSAAIVSSKCKPRDVAKRMEALEKALHCRIQTSGDLVSVNKHATKPREQVITYNEETSFMPIEADLRKLLDDCDEIINPIVQMEIKRKQEERNAYARSLGDQPILRFPENDDDSDEENSEPLDENCVYETITVGASPASILKNVYTVLQQLGLWCASQVINRYYTLLPQLQREAQGKLNTEHIRLYDILENTLAAARKLYEKQTPSIDMVRPKVQQIVHLFKDLAPTHSTYTPLDSFRGILFVEHRVIAWMLSEYLVALALHSSTEYGFLKPTYIVGHGTHMSFMRHSSMNVSRQNTVLESFRSGETNLMVATKVVEEGLDIPKCNLVVRFDLPKEFCSYVQSMGRARAEKALYVLLVASTERQKLEIDLELFKAIENFLNTKCSGYRPVPPEEETFEFYNKQHKLGPFYPSGQTGACLTMNSALSTLNMYLSHLPCDRYTTLVPLIRYAKNKRGEIICTMTMPLGCPLRGSVSGDPMLQKDDARRATAYRVCKVLCEIGELNENLLPAFNYLEKFSNQLGIAPFEAVTSAAPLPGTNKRRLIYDKSVAFDLHQAYPKSGQPCFLHLIRIQKESKEFNNDCNSGDNPKTTDFDPPTCCFAILSSKPISDVCPFGLYAKCKYIVHLEREWNFNGRLSQVELDRLEFFHCTVFGVILRIVGRCMEFSPDNAESAFLVVPVCRLDQTDVFEIDWDSVTRAEIIQKAEKDDKLSIPEIGSIIRPVYGDESIHSKRFVVRKVSNPVAMQSSFPFTKNWQEKITYKSYFEGKYNLKLHHEFQPILEVNYAPNAMNLLLPTNLVKPESLSTDRNLETIHLLPELVAILPLEEESFQHAFFLPAILHRLNGLLVAAQLTDRIVTEANIAHSVILPNVVNLGYRLEEISRNVTIDDGIIFCSLNQIPSKVDAKKLYALIFQALTTRSATSWDDLERFELIGDSFLKFIVSVFLFTKFDQTSEGCLTVLRTGLIRNSNLSFHAKNKNLPQMLNTVSFQPRTNWLPPGYIIDQEFIRQLIKAKVPMHLWPFADKEDRSNINMDTQWVDTLQERWNATDYSTRDTVQQPILDFLTGEIEKNWENGQNSASGLSAESNEGSKELFYDHYRQNLISDKTVADSLEALIGVVLATCGQASALRLINWFSLRLHPNSDQITTPKIQDDPHNLQLFNWNPVVKTALLKEIPVDIDFLKIYSGLDLLEQQLGYKFNDISFLREALVHPSYTEHPVTNNYQKLEFLGDAILDYLITMNLYKRNPHMCPGDMTDLRSSLVDNCTFAFLSVKSKLYRHIRYKSVNLHHAIDKYLAYHKKLKDPKDSVYLFGENDVLELEDVEIPKALGDIFESVAGAIYVDSGFSLETVWKIFHPIIKDLIDLYSKSLPINPIRKLTEFDDSTKFTVKPKVKESYIVTVTLRGKSYNGSGRTKPVAKQAAAKCALRDLKLSSHRVLT